MTDSQVNRLREPPTRFSRPTIRVRKTAQEKSMNCQHPVWRGQGEGIGRFALLIPRFLLRHFPGVNFNFVEYSHFSSRILVTFSLFSRMYR